MSNIVQVRNEIAAYLVAKIDGLNQVKVLPGRMTEQDINKLVTSNKTLHISFLGTQSVDPNADETRIVPFNFGVYVSVAGANKEDRGISIMETVMACLVTMPFDAITAPGALSLVPGSIENLYGAGSAQQPSIFGCSFAVPFIFERDTFKIDLETYPDGTVIAGDAGVFDEAEPA